MNAAKPIRVLCVDDHPLVRKGIASILANEKDMRLVAEGGDGRDAVELFRAYRPDVILMDLRMPGIDGIEATKTILRESPEARIIALTSYEGDQDIHRALAAGVWAYLLKESVHTDVLRAIRMVHSGKRLIPAEAQSRPIAAQRRAVLTPRELEVLGFVAQGLSNKEIGDRIGTAGGTVKIHLQNILSKLGAADRTHAVAIAIQRNLLRLE
jgi:DNA-binding NarL/FixJ family response regulator